MFSEHDRAFKEWALVCEALKEGRQTVLIRKGGIREEDGVFRVNDPAFFLLPTYEHQNPDLVQPAWRDRLAAIQAGGFDPNSVTIDAYATVETVAVAKTDAQAYALAEEHIWNDQYIRMRLDFNPYDPLYILVLRAYHLPEAVTLPLRPEYVGCKSWVTLEQSLSTEGAVPALSEEEFEQRRTTLMERLLSAAREEANR
jgi:hypothetical protein